MMIRLSLVATLFFFVTTNITYAQDTLEKGVFKSKKHGYVITIPEGWDTQMNDQLETIKASEGGILEGTSKDKVLRFFFAYETKVGWNTLKYIEACEAKAKNKKCFDKKELKKSAGKWYRRDYKWKFYGKRYLTTKVFTSKGSNHYCLSMTFKESKSYSGKRFVNELIKNIGTLSSTKAQSKSKSSAGSKSGAGKQIPSPWGSCKAGSWVHMKITGETKVGGKVHKNSYEVKYTLTDAGDGTYYKQTTVTKIGGRWGRASEKRIPLGIKPTSKKLNQESGQEEIKTPAGTFKCKWVKTKLNKTELKQANFISASTKTWTCSDVPMGCVKIESKSQTSKSSSAINRVLIAYEKK